MKYSPEHNEFFGSKKSILGKIPHIMWHITDICALKCPFCFATKTEETTELKHIPKIVDLLITAECQKIDIGGGEPLNYSSLESLCRLIWDAKIHTTITTSGVGKYKNKKFIKDNCDQFSRIIVSIDGPRDLHNRLRGYNSAWEQAVEIIQDIPSSERAKRVRINTVLTRQLVEGNWLPVMADFIESLQVKEWCLIQPHPANKKESFHLHSSDLDDLDREYEKALLLTKNTKILKRAASLYSTYWVLNPSGNLSQHRSGSIDSDCISLVDCNSEQLLSSINRIETKVP